MREISEDFSVGDPQKILNLENRASQEIVLDSKSLKLCEKSQKIFLCDVHKRFYIWNIVHAKKL